MNLLRWQTWNGSSWGVASMENSTWMLWQGENEALFPSSAFNRFCNYMTIYQSSGVYHTFTVKKTLCTDTSQIWISLIRELENTQKENAMWKDIQKDRETQRIQRIQADTSMAVTVEEKQTRIVIFPKAPAQHSNTQCLCTKKNSRFQAPKNRARTT